MLTTGFSRIVLVTTVFFKDNHAYDGFLSRIIMLKTGFFKDNHAYDGFFQG